MSGKKAGEKGKAGYAPSTIAIKRKIEDQRRVSRLRQLQIHKRP